MTNNPKGNPMSELVERLEGVRDEHLLWMQGCLEKDKPSYHQAEIHKESANLYQEAITALSQEPGDVEADLVNAWIESVNAEKWNNDDPVHVKIKASKLRDGPNEIFIEAYHAARSLYARRMAEKDARIAELEGDIDFLNRSLQISYKKNTKLVDELVEKEMKDIGLALKGDSDA